MTQPTCKRPSVFWGSYGPRAHPTLLDVKPAGALKKPYARRVVEARQFAMVRAPKAKNNVAVIWATKVRDFGIVRMHRLIR